MKHFKELPVGAKFLCHTKKFVKVDETIARPIDSFWSFRWNTELLVKEDV